MGQINASKWGRVWIASQTSHTAARNAAAGTGVSVNPTSDATPSVAYRVSSGRGSYTYTIYRSFFQFNVTGVTAATAASMRVTGYSANSATVIYVKSTAFSSGNLTTSDFNNVIFTTPYSNSTSWLIAGNNTSLNSTAISDINANTSFTIALLEYGHDQQDSDPAPLTGNFDAGIAWSTTPVLDVVEPSGPGLTVNTISSIQSVNTVTFSTLASINTVS